MGCPPAQVFEDFSAEAGAAFQELDFLPVLRCMDAEGKATFFDTIPWFLE